MCIEQRLPLVGPRGYPGCPKWVLEVEFETTWGNVFRVPVRFYAITLDYAKLVSEAICLGFEENYSAICSSGPEFGLTSLEASRLHGMLTTDARSSILIYWLQVPAAAGRPPMGRSEAMQLVARTPGGGSVTPRRQRVPIYRVREGRRLEADEPFVWVVQPGRALLRILIAIEEDASAASGTLRLLQEGEWRSAGVKDYMYRIDRDHSDSGVRHVHICHRKHLAARNRQVSWSQSGRRHDPSTFHTSFRGIETARQIARDVLNLPDDFILEERPNLLQREILEKLEVDALPPASHVFAAVRAK